MHDEHGCMHQRKLNLRNDQDYLHIYVWELNHSKISHILFSVEQSNYEMASTESLQV